MEILIPLLIIVFICIILCIKVVPQAEAYVVERVGSYLETWKNGLHFKIPFIDRIANRLTLKEIVKDFKPQPVITKDNVTMQIDTVVYYQITDPKLYTYGVENPIVAIENLTATTLRNIIGELELDQTLTSRDIRVEVKNILPPRDIQEAMEKQMRAERERREKILQAEGEKKSSILIAEGEKQSAILRAEADKETAILKATGEAEAILRINQAEAESIKLLREANADKNVIALKGLEAATKMADGKATKIIVPSNLQDIASITTTISEMLKDQNNTK